MAFISKRGNRWCVRYRYTDELGAVKEKRVSGFLTKEDAMAAAKTLEAKSNAGIDVNGDRATCGQIMERWFSEHCAFLSATTRAKYSDGIDRLAKLDVYNLPVRRCTQATLSALILALQEGAGGGRPLALRTAIAHTESLRMALAWAAQRQLIPINPLAGAKLPKLKKGSNASSRRMTLPTWSRLRSITPSASRSSWPSTVACAGRKWQPSAGRMSILSAAR